jgi:GDPmannose 4,6-dehydratase
MKKKKILIMGITGQDGSYLAKLFLNKKFIVHGTSRQKGDWAKNLKYLNISNKIRVYQTDKKFNNLNKILSNNYDYIFFLGGQSSVIKSYGKLEHETYDSQIIPISIILEFIRLQEKKKSKFMYSSSSEIFGCQKKTKLNEKSKKNPQSPYGLSKLIGYEIVKSYREMFNLPVFTIIFFNHESILRNKDFIFRKIINYLKRRDFSEKMNLGNLNIIRDWGSSEEYMQIIYKIIKHKKIEDYVLATGHSSKLSEIIRLFFLKFNLNYKNYIKIDKKLFRKFDIKENYANIKKLRKIIKTYPKKKFLNLIELFN